MADHESELELELEQVFHEGELEDETESGHLEGEGWLGALGNIAGSLLGEEELELEDEYEDELEAEDELEDEDEDEGEGEGWLGALGNIAGSLLGEEEMEDEDESEQFFGGIGKFLKKSAPFLKKIAKVAAPMVGTAIGGPFGGMLGGLASKALGEGEYEDEMEDEMEAEGEAEVVHEIVNSPVTHEHAAAEMMAEAASLAHGEGEAEAMVGAAAVSVLSRADRRALRRILPHLVKGTAILTRILRRRRKSKILVRAVPTVLRRTIKDLKRQAARGVKVTRRTAARAAAKQVRRVLGSHRACTAAVVKNVKASKAYKRGKRPLRSRAPLSTAAARRRRSRVR